MNWTHNPHDGGIAAKSRRGCKRFRAEVFPQAVGAAKSWNAARSRNARAGKHGNADAGPAQSFDEIVHDADF